jgi:hypothetical protein
LSLGEFGGIADSILMPRPIGIMFESIHREFELLGINLKKNHGGG